MSKPLTVRVLVALQRARVVARRDLNRAVQYLLEARVQFAAAVRFCVAAAAVTTLAACGGGGDEPQAISAVSVQPVDCGGGVTCK